MNSRQTIFVSAYPKSGSTWLTRLLGDVLNSPTGGCMPEEDSKEVATEGQDRPGPYIVRKGHFVLIDDDTGPVVPRPHRLAWKRLTNEKIVFLVRDPRDICISGAYHWRTSPAEFLERMIKGDVAKCGRWDEYCNKWISTGPKIDAYPVKYEDLIEYVFTTLGVVIQRLNLDFVLFIDRSHKAIMRQSFSTRKTQIHLAHFNRTPESMTEVEQELRRNNMRKGIVGDWHNHFTPEMNERIWQEFGWMMEGLGYSK